jgi:hypothetical protein
MEPHAWESHTAALEVDHEEQGMTKLFMMIIAGVLLTSSPVIADTVVTTYVTKVQEERKSTRWTLTEWLRIKERMKMMDLWLAMFSNPQKDVFRPELNLQYGAMNGNMSLSDSGDNTESGTLSGTQARAQMWLTNILTGSTGVKTLNIDFGIEGYGRQANGFTADQSSDPAAGTTSSAPVAGSTPAAVSTVNASRDLSTNYATGNFRIFGDNIQDTSLILKYGQFTTKNAIPVWEDEENQKTYTGNVAGAEMNIYLLNFLGLEGNYLQYGNSSTLQGDNGFAGTYYDYSAFIEISLLRLSVGNYREDWSFSNQGNKLDTEENGFVGGVKLQF